MYFGAQSPFSSSENLGNMWTLLCRWRSFLLYSAHTLSHFELMQQTRTLGKKVKRNIKRQKWSVCCNAPSPPPSWMGWKKLDVFEPTTIHSSLIPHYSQLWSCCDGQKADKWSLLQLVSTHGAVKLGYGRVTACTPWATALLPCLFLVSLSCPIIPLQFSMAAGSHVLNWSTPE